uniref:DNA repair endonuclease XPF n=1 Tax=Bombyx mori TaxID=7091 RepID=A0A8R2R0C7_BOMMO|nr:DNA repair endonuclease XPF-like isoform X2 [Bombyx mori]
MNAKIQEDENVENTVSNLKNKFPMLSFEKQIFIDVFEKDALVIMAKGHNYNNIVANLLWVHKDPGNLVLVINSNDNEEKYFTEKNQLTPVPTLGNERERSYLEGGIHFVSTRILVVDLLKNRVPISHITGIVVLRAHTVLESCQEAFALRLYRQKNKTGFIKAFSNSPISFTFGYHQVEKVMRALFVTELFLWPRFHGNIIRNLKSRQAQAEELHIPLTTNMSYIQTCLLDIMNYTVKQLKSINRSLDMKEITTENCITKKFHKILQSQLDCVWHQLSTRTKEYIQDLKILRSMIINLIHDDAVSLYALVSKYRTPEYAQINSGWILLESAEQLFKYAKARVFNKKNEFDPEPSPKWKYLSDLLSQEIPDEVNKKKDSNLSNTKILILCQDNRTCSQLNHFLTMGANRYLLYTAFKREIPINAVATKYEDIKNTVPVETKDKTDKKSDTKEGKSTDEGTRLDDSKYEELNTEESRTNYLLTLTQSSAHCSKDNATVNESLFEPISQVMVVPSYQDGKTDEYFQLTNEEEVQPTDSRKAGQNQSKEKPLVIVDMREFRSDLPSLLHKRGINIEPVTIAIGDYILTPDICVERKSISDLIGSLNSGRLYTQCTQMCRNYSRPILLIEFDQNKPFNLQGHFVVSTDISGADIQQKLQLLTIHFPRLKLVWSPSPYATAELFYELKQGRNNPNIAEAIALSGENTADDMNYERYNILVHDFVQKLPGVTSKNINRIMNKGISLDHLITLTKEELSDVVENKNEAETLYSILHVKARPMDAKEEKFGKKKFTGKLYRSKK